MSQLIRGMVYLREDTCPICQAERSLELYDNNDNRAYFSNILDQDRLEKLHYKRYYYIKCSNCKREFQIDWSYPNHIPVPLLGNKLQYFLEDYNSSYRQ